MTQQAVSQQNNANFIWSIADLLRGPYKPHQYGAIVLPFTILRRLDCVLDPTKQAVLDELRKRGDSPAAAVFLTKASGNSFYNTSAFTLQSLVGDSASIKANLVDYLHGFSENVRDIFERFEFEKQIEKLDAEDLLYLLTQRFAAIDLHPQKVSNIEMGLMFEELIRKFAENSNETAGEHFTPREVIRLMVSLLFIADDEALSEKGVVRSIYDPTAGTGGMLSVADEYLLGHNPDARLVMYGQEINGESYAICKADLVIKGQDINHIVLGDTLTDDGLVGETFDYCLSNPPFGVDWNKQKPAVLKEHEEHGFEGRFGPGLPRVSDGSLLFLLHLVKKLRPKVKGGGRAGIVLNGSPLFTGGAGSGESEIRRYLLENDLLEAIVALPTDMFYNTGIATYLWIIDNDKRPERRGTVQLIDGTSFSHKMRKTLGSKRKELGPQDIARIVQLYGGAEESDLSKTFKNEHFGYRTITVARPLRLNWALTPERLGTALKAKAFVKLTDADRQALFAALAEPVETKPVTDAAALAKRVKQHTSTAGVLLTAPQLKALLTGLSERDDSAPLVTDAKGNTTPDTDARDTENVPLGEDIHEYFAREVLPHAPDAWIDESKTKIGYEIPFTRYFYTYVPPRPLDEIDADLNKLIGEITELLNEVEK
ncbi:type I restriction-modification system subunit M [Cryobacterium tagatosivorans]|uniref:site-specific DNA-methyltransferase (adenine-specific) n=1 Tax=Cryobacterium tagatosivorans TaxID=1259199 RepID=A0A4R8UCG6_9MICO|nr:class I SAM-dependent DNA methyltransferase [Cryobacterium tagatosivorans]TFB47263.1 SAM-dependent DNA methyltransferase [Cryobacterium tagatosivorans]